MYPFLETMDHVLQNAQLYPDRTGDGRWRVFGAMERYDLSQGLPLVSTRQIFPVNMIRELAGFIHGSTNVKDLTESFWGRWAVKESDVRAYVDQTVKDAMANPPEGFDEFLAQLRKDHPDNVEGKVAEIFAGQMSQRIGEIGPMYGALWRAFPYPHNKIRRPWWFKGFEDVPSDRRDRYKEGFLKEIAMSNGMMQNDQETWESYVQTMYLAEGYDQLNALVKGLKEKPYSARHCLTAYHPGLNGPEDVQPEFNVLADYGALHPCHCFVQFAVLKDKDGQYRLSCMLYMRSSDVYIGRPYNIGCYSIMTALLAHTLGFGLGDFIIASGDTHVYNSHVESAKVQLQRQPFKPTQFKINPELKSIFDFKPEDIELLNYQPHGKLGGVVTK